MIKGELFVAQAVEGNDIVFHAYKHGKLLWAVSYVLIFCLYVSFCGFELSAQRNYSLPFVEAWREGKEACLLPFCWANLQ